jgi:hypothetical protein
MAGLDLAWPAYPIPEARAGTGRKTVLSTLDAPRKTVQDSGVRKPGPVQLLPGRAGDGADPAHRNGRVVNQTPVTVN